MKKIKCKHELDPREEIQARRLKDKILSEDKEVYLLLKNSFLIWSDRDNEMLSFEDYLKNKDKVLYSAYKRVLQVKPDIISSIMISR